MSIHQCFALPGRKATDDLNEAREGDLKLMCAASRRVGESADIIMPSNARNAIRTFTKQIAAIKSLQITICTIAVCMCAFCGVEGGYQLHLTHAHSALSCLKFSLPAPVVPEDEIVPVAYEKTPTCKEPDELGQPWRLGLVLLDLLGFIAFGKMGSSSGKHIIFAGATGD